jgi:hypothetical protein
MNNNKYQVRVYKNTKIPYAQDWTGKKVSNFKIDIEPNVAYNTALVCGKLTNTTVVDLDIYKWSANHIFYKTFGKDFIKKFNTYTVKTGSGGYHLYFQYIDMPNINSDLQIDVKNNNGLIITAGSVVDGKAYKVIQNKKIKKMPKELLQFLLDKCIKNKKVIKKKYTREILKQEDTDYNIHLTEDEFYTICKTLPKEYIDNFNSWLVFTTACKVMNMPKVWETISKQSSHYSEKNNHYWNSVDGNAIGTLYNVVKNSSYPDILDLAKYTPVQPNTYETDITISRQKLGFDIIGKGSYIIKSDTGTGKTTSFVKHIENTGLKFISIVDRVSLSYSHHHTFNTKGISTQHYSDKLKEDNNNIICLNSIMRIQKFDFSKYVLFLDEITATLKSLITCKTLSKWRMFIFSLFKDIIRECHSVVAVDADIDDCVIRFLRSLRSDFTYIQNDYKHNRDVPATEITDETEFIKQIKKEDKYIICCDSAQKAQHIYDMLNDEEVVLITDETIGDNIANFSDIDKFDKVIYSPKIVRGIDSQMKRNVYCYYKEHTISPEDMIQQLTRCRNISHLYFMFTKKKYNTIETKEYYTQLLRESDAYAQQQFIMLGEKDKDEYISYLIEYYYRILCYDTNKYAHFCKLLSYRGFNVNRKLIKSISIMMTKEEKQESHDILVEEFDLDNYPQANKYLRLEKKQITPAIIELYINKRKLEQHFVLCKYLFRDDLDCLGKLEDSLDFKLNRLRTSEAKIMFLRKFMIRTGTSNKNLMVQRKLNDKDIKELEKEYRVKFRDRSKVKFDNQDDIQKILIKILKNIFGSDIVKTKRVKKERTRVYSINGELIKFTTDIYNLRN